MLEEQYMLIYVNLSIEGLAQAVRHISLIRSAKYKESLLG